MLNMIIVYCTVKTIEYKLSFKFVDRIYNSAGEHCTLN